MIRDRGLFGRRTKSFTLQWHLTNACGWHCRHCYDREERGELPLAKALALLADFQGFCRGRRVTPQVCFTGGDPLLSASFWELHRAAVEARLPYSILGNPVAPAVIQRLVEVQAPAYYQVSLEGLQAHNDDMRGAGHFERVLTFLAAARRLGLNTHVMLTLTRANLDQVIPLGTRLRGLTERFTFNRLAQVGRGADLEPPRRTEFVALLQEYTRARRLNPVFGFKDNLFNIIRLHFRRRPCGGCTGFGCGAAFNFVALLPDGEVHACRKYPSPLGNMNEASLASIYDSAAARRYRAGPLPCRRCRLRNVCSGCPAVTFGQGLRPLADRDPFCFLADRAALLAEP